MTSADDADEGSVKYDPLVELIQMYEGVKVGQDSAPAEDLPVEEALQKHIVSGTKKGLETRLEEALETYSPLQVINEILLEGMKTVGELFGSGKMQLPFVLQSAETMKAAVRFLEPKMEKSETQEKGSILLATVAGDVHDIGKNLVDIILSNNGFRVVNIGIKQPIDVILDTAEKQRCDVIGLSGLLVKSTLVMKENLEVMNERGKTNIPVILGGAALTRGYVERDLRDIYQGKVFYAQDAFEGLGLMETMEDLKTADYPLSELGEDRVTSHRVDVYDPALYEFNGIKSDAEVLPKVPDLPFYGVKEWVDFDPFEVFKFINTTSLFRGQWQYKKQEGMSNPEFTEWLEVNVGPIYEKVQNQMAKVVHPKVKWGYYPCGSEGNSLVLFDESGSKEIERFTFPRQRDGRLLCLADFYRPISEFDRLGGPDVVAFQIVTMGDEVTALERELYQAGSFQQYLYVHGMGVESAEALAEYWHKQVRNELGLAAFEPDSLKGMFGLKYAGARYSFGYPACPRIEDQAKLFKLLEPESIGITLTEEFMMYPEQSTSAIIAHHPLAKYFNIR